MTLQDLETTQLNRVYRKLWHRIESHRDRSKCRFWNHYRCQFPVIMRHLDDIQAEYRRRRDEQESITTATETVDERGE